MTATGPCNAPDGAGVVDVVTLGESMVTFLPSRPGRLADVPSFDRAIGGAESNVACTLAAAGHSVRWVSRVGVDGFGDHLVEAIGAYGVDVTAVRRDPARPTGIYFRTAGDRSTAAHEVAYYRTGSAASAMTVGNTDLDAVRAGRVLHLSGITAALSEGCLGLMRELTAPRAGRPLISFDVNYRPGLWPDADGAGVLLELARGADVVFVGEDEAEEAWGVTGGPEAVRAVLPEPGVLVVKQGRVGATAFVSAAGGGGLFAQFPAPLKPTGDRPSRQAQPTVPHAAPPAAGRNSGEPAAGRSAEPASRPASPVGCHSAEPAGHAVAEPVGRHSAEPASHPTPPGGSHSAEPAAGYSVPPAVGRNSAEPAAGHSVPPAAGRNSAEPAAGHSVQPAAGRNSAEPAAGHSVQPAGRHCVSSAVGRNSAESAGSRAAGAAPDPKKGGTPQARASDTAPASAPTSGTFVPALAVDVVATIGAGDAFAAGFLSATLRNLPLRERLRHGHLTAAATLTAQGDLAPPPARHHADRLAALDDDAWGKLRLGPGWTQADDHAVERAVDRADEEVRTP